VILSVNVVSILLLSGVAVANDNNLVQFRVLFCFRVCVVCVCVCVCVVSGHQTFGWQSLDHSGNFRRGFS